MVTSLQLTLPHTVATTISQSKRKMVNDEFATKNLTSMVSPTVSEKPSRCRWNNAVGRVLGPKQRHQWSAVLRVCF